MNCKKKVYGLRSNSCGEETMEEFFGILGEAEAVKATDNNKEKEEGDEDEPVDEDDYVPEVFDPEAERQVSFKINFLQKIFVSNLWF